MSAAKNTAADRLSSSAYLGATLRSVLIAPTAGFESARRGAERRVRSGDLPAEGYTPYVLSAAGGAALFILWLKVSSLLGIREVAPDDFRWGFLVGAGLMGAVVALLGQLIWGRVGRVVLKSLGTEVRSGDLRMIWGASAGPQMFGLLLLMPIDLLVIGPDAFTSATLPDPVSSAWASLSMALGVALTVWSAGLFVKGVQVVTRVRWPVLVAASAGASVCLTVVVLSLRFGAVSLMESLT